MFSFKISDFNLNYILKLKSKKLSLSRTIMAAEGPKIRLITQEGDNLEVSMAFIQVNSDNNSNSVYLGRYVNR